MSTNNIQENEYIELIRSTQNLISQIQATRIRLRRNSRINMYYIHKILSLEKCLTELVEHFKDIMDGVN